MISKFLSKQEKDKHERCLRGFNHLQFMELIYEFINNIYNFISEGIRFTMNHPTTTNAFHNKTSSFLYMRLVAEL